MTEFLLEKNSQGNVKEKRVSKIDSQMSFFLLFISIHFLGEMAGQDFLSKDNQLTTLFLES